MNEQLIQPPNKLFVSEYHDHLRYDYYLAGDIGDPEDYLDLCAALRAAGPQDEFFIRINSGGGQVRSGNQIINAINESEATVVGFIEHNCGSMATFIFLACHTWGVSKYAEWFSHTVSAGNYGKENETWEAAQFLRKQTHKRIREEYTDFLTEDEIEKLLTGGDLYLDADEIMERLEGFAEAREQSDAYEDEESSPKSLEQMIEDAVMKAFEKNASLDILSSLTEQDQQLGLYDNMLKTNIEYKPKDDITPMDLLDAERQSK